MAIVEKITPCLWFDKQAEDAAKYYTGIFKDSSIGHISRYGKAGFEQHQMPEGTALVVEFKLLGQSFSALNGGPIFKFNEAVSFMIHCENQQEVDHFWNSLTSDGGQEQQCGWLKDKFGLSWQVVPVQLGDMMRDKDSAKSGRMMGALMQMKKLDIKKLEDAFEGK